MATNTVQTQYTCTALRKSFSSNFPKDDTIPQSGEGSEIITLAITPTNVSNLLVIEACIMIDITAVGGPYPIVLSLFQDATADALASSIEGVNDAVTRLPSMFLRHIMVAGTTSATTFKLRGGAFDNSARTWKVNSSTGVPYLIYAGALKSSLQITEINV